MDTSDDNQRNIKQSEVDELSKHSGKNIKGYMPSMAQTRNLWVEDADHFQPAEDQRDEVERIEAQEVSAPILAP